MRRRKTLREETEARERRVKIEDWIFDTCLVTFTILMVVLTVLITSIVIDMLGLV